MSKATVSLWFKKGGRGKQAKIEKAIAEETDPFPFKSKAIQGSKYHKLELELFSFFRHNETKKACLTDDVLTEQDRAIARAHEYSEPQSFNELDCRFQT